MKGLVCVMVLKELESKDRLRDREVGCRECGKRECYGRMKRKTRESEGSVTHPHLECPLELRIELCWPTPGR